MIRVPRKVLIEHLERLCVRGLITEAVVGDGFSSSALAIDQLLFVKVDPLKEVGPLKEPIGLLDLPQLIAAINDLGSLYTASEVVAIRHEGGCLIVSLGEAGELRWKTAHPSTIATAVEPHVVAALEEKKPTGDPIPLRKVTVDSVAKMFTRIKAKECTIRVSEESTWIMVGNDHGHTANVPLEMASGSHTSFEEEVQHEIILSRYFSDVLSTVNCYSSGKIHVGIPKGPVLVTRDGYEWMVQGKAPSVE